MKSKACHGCGTDIEFEPILYGGKEVGSPRFCDPCLDADRAEDDRQEAIEQYRQRVDGSGLPTRLREIEIPDSELGQIVRKWVSGEIQGLCLTGPVGVGKTYLAAAACWLYLQKRGASWISVARMMTQLRAGFDDKARNAAIKSITAESAAVLDDLDKVNPTEFGREVIFAAIDGRIEAGVPLLLTTNLEPAAIGDRLGEPVMSRIAGHCEVVRMVGPDRRVAG